MYIAAKIATMIIEPILNKFEVLKSSLVKTKTLSFSLLGESKPLTTKAKKKDIAIWCINGSISDSEVLAT